MTFSRIDIKIFAGTLVAALAVAASCGTNEAECETPGANRKCTCEDGRGSLQTCNAFAEWGPCYCDTPVCGDGDLDQGEECDDGNNDSGDGCTADCESEGSGQGGNPSSSSVGAMGGFGGSGAAGGFGGAPGGFGGAPGGMAGMGGAGGAGGN